MTAEPDNPTDFKARIHDERVRASGADGAEVNSDRSLMDRVRVREQLAMTEVFDRYASLVYSVALRVLRDTGQAEDVTQDIFFQLWRNPDSFSSARGSLCAWLVVVARNRAIDHLRRRRPSEAVDDVVLASDTNLEVEAERNTIIERVRRVWDELPQEQQLSLEMAFFEGMTHTEIAEKTGQPLGTVKTRIRSALTSLRKRLEP